MIADPSNSSSKLSANSRSFSKFWLNFLEFPFSFKNASAWLAITENSFLSAWEDEKFCLSFDSSNSSSVSKIKYSWYWDKSSSGVTMI